MRPQRVLMFGLLTVFASIDCNRVTGSNPTQLTANVVDPLSVDAVSLFNSCVGHPYPESNGPNSAKNYFWGNSTNFGTNDQLKEFAACSGTMNQNIDDTNDPSEFIRGESVHLFCDDSSTSVRYFHLNFAPALLGQHVTAGDFVRFASLAAAGQSWPNWRTSSPMDIAVNFGDDSKTQDYFASLDGAAFAAWSARGVTSISQTTKPGNVSCTNWQAYPGSPNDVLSFTPAR